MSKIREVKLKGFVTYNDVQSQYLNASGQPEFEQRWWDIYITNPRVGKTSEDAYLSKILEEFGTHENVEIIIRSIDDE